MKIRVESARVAVCGALLLLFTWFSWLCAMKVSDYRAISLRYDTPITQSQAERARSYAVKTQSPFFPTYWSQGSADCANSFATAQTTLLTVWGDSRLVLNAPLLSGNYPAISQVNVCAVSDSLAWQLWGDKDVVGLTVEIGAVQYTVCGVFSEQSQVAMVGASDTAEPTWRAVELELAVPGTPSGGRKAAASAFALSSGLGRANSYIDGSAVAWVSQCVALLPLLALMVVLLVHYAKIGFRRLKSWRGAVIFVLLLAVAMLVPLLLEFLPAGMLPTRWSDFDFWRRLLQTMTDDVKGYLMRRPLFIDGKVKLWQLTQAGIALIQAVLLTMTLMRCGARGDKASAHPQKEHALE